MAWLADHIADLIGISALFGILSFAILYQRKANWRVSVSGRSIMYLSRGLAATIILLVLFSFLPEIWELLGLSRNTSRPYRWIMESLVYTPMAWACWNMYFALRKTLGLKSTPLFFVTQRENRTPLRDRLSRLVHWKQPKEIKTMTTFGENVEAEGDALSVGDEVIVESATVELVQPTQVANPGKASLRTFVQSAIAGLLLVNPVFLAIQQVMQETTEITFPGWAWATVNGVVLGSALLGSAAARIMAVPGFNDWIERTIPVLATHKLEK